jgi:SPX domain
MSHSINGQSSGKIVEVPENEDQDKDQSASHDVTDQIVDSTADIPIDDDTFQTDEDIENTREARKAHQERDRRGSVRSLDGIKNDPLHPHTIEITLHADSEFFNLLTNELSSIDELQARQKKILTSQVSELGNHVRAVTRPTDPKSSSDLYTWRQIFELYRDASVFFATTERDHGARNAEQARERVQWFANQLQTQNLV